MKAHGLDGFCRWCDDLATRPDSLFCDACLTEIVAVKEELRRKAAELTAAHEAQVLAEEERTAA